MRIQKYLVAWLAALAGCAGHTPVLFEVYDGESGQPITGAHVIADVDSTSANPPNPSTPWAIENIVWGVAMEKTGQLGQSIEGLTDAAGDLTLNVPHRDSGVHISISKPNYFSFDGAQRQLSCDDIKSAARSKRSFKFNLCLGRPGRVIIVVPVGYRGPLLVRDCGRVEHAVGQRIFKFAVNVTGITNVPDSPPVLWAQDPALLDAEWQDGSPLRRAQPLVIPRSSQSPRLPEEEIALRPIEYGAGKFGVYVVGTLDDAQHYAAAHNLLDDPLHESLHKLF